LPLPEGAWHAFELWDRRYLRVRTGALSFALVPPHACRLLALRPAGALPRLVAVDAHIGMGAVDVAGCSAGPGTLRLALTPAGRRRRTLYFAVPEAASVAATIDGQPASVRLLDGLAAVDVQLDAEAELVLRLE